MPFSKAADNQFILRRRESGETLRIVEFPGRMEVEYAGVALLECGVEGLFPARVVDGPENRGFMSCGEGLGPDGSISFISGDVETVDDGHAAGEFALGFDFEEVMGLLGDYGRIQSDGHGYWVGQGNAVLAGLHEEGFLSAAVAFDGECGDRIVEAEDTLDLRGIQNGFVAAEVPADKFDGKAAAGDDASGFGIAPDVVFGGGRDVAFAARGATHYDAAADFGGEGGPFFYSQRDVRERAQRDQD